MGSAATSFSASGVGAGTYYVRVRAANNVGASAPSNEVIVSVGSPTASLTGQWIGLSPDGLVIDAASGTCDTEEDIAINLTQSGTSLTGTLTERIRKISPLRPTCDTVGALYGPWPISGTVGAGVLTIIWPVEKGRVITLSGTFTANRISMSVIGGVGTMTVIRQ